MKTMKILSLTLFMSIFCVGISFAQQQDKKGQRAKATPEERAAKRIEMMKKTLDLTPDQVTKLQAAQTQFAKDWEQARTAKKENRQNMKAKREAYDAQLKTILTPEQYQKYQDQRKNMKKGGDRQGKRNKGDKGGDQQGECKKDGKKPQGKGNKTRVNSQNQVN